MIYNPAFDLYHCVYRFLLMISKISDDSCIEIDRLRIYDFYILFPYKIRDVKLKKNEKELRKSRTELKIEQINPYNHIKQDRKVFERLKSYQLIALNYIASYGIIDAKLLSENLIFVKDKRKLNECIVSLLEEAEEDFSLMNWLFEKFKDVPMNGEYGLMYRTNLMEWKYDPA